ncbi:MAG: hypothetical protein EBX61_12865, partial [Betaproteobacteria bacterium]|nr:hypothetical protein [Betaproteobacteria bacterium]
HGCLEDPQIGLDPAHLVGQHDAMAQHVVHQVAHVLRQGVVAAAHQGQGVFAGLPDRFSVVRYHSLAIERASLPECLSITAQTEDGEIMGVRHREFPIEGLQFHPESIDTEHGMEMLERFLKSN